jgi:transcriptional regulator GlxA family with amidase domain
MLATEPGPVALFPALTVEPDATVADFDGRHPEGADYVIVPAMSRDDDPVVLAWLQSQAGKGAVIIGVCAGVKVVGAARLLDGKRATTHWYYLNELLNRSPTIDYVANRRMVVDQGIATTTGITASMPMMLTLIEAIAGRPKAEAVALELGLPHWDARHDSSAFKITRPFASTVLGNKLAFWNRDRFGITLQPGVDEVSLALTVDAWSRTYRSSVVTLAPSTSAVETANGIRVLPDRTTGDWPEGYRLSIVPGSLPADSLNRALQAITERYGARTTDVVAMQLEYPRFDDVR